QTAIVLDFEGERRAVLHTALDTAGPNRAAVIGTEGWIDIDAVWYTASSFTVRDSAGAVVERFETPSNGSRGMHHQAAELERVVAQGEAGRAVLSPDETVEIMRTLDAVRAQIGLAYPGE